MDIAFDVWIVHFRTLSIGTRIEACKMQHSLFLQEEKAVEFAYKLAEECYKDLGSKGTLDWDEEGDYILGETGYEDWPRYRIKIEKKRFSNTADTPLQISFSDDT
jgi:hypothetical protein